MARIPEAEVQRLKEEIAVQRLIEEAGIELKRVGEDLAGRCPFHEDGEPSLKVTPAKNLWHCFGCQCGGGLIDWVMKLKGVSFRHAVELLKDESVLVAGSVSGGELVKRSTVRSLPPPVAPDADERALLVQVVEYLVRVRTASNFARPITSVSSASSAGLVIKAMEPLRTCSSSA